MIRLLTILFVVGVLTASYANAAPLNSYANAAPLNYGSRGGQLNADFSACPPGPPVLDVTRKVVNSLDSGTGLNEFGFVWWATSEYVQQISVVETGGGMFCATVTSRGSFESVNGDGPGCAVDVPSTCGDQSLEAGVIGTFHGGYTNTFTGTFAPGNMPTQGIIGTLDCDCKADTAAGCPGPCFSAWRSEYFPGFSGSALPWWGWIYDAGNNGTWVNSIDGNDGNEGNEGNEGNITGTPPEINVPTLSEWGLIAMAGMFGIAGFMVIRRRKVTA